MDDVADNKCQALTFGSNNPGDPNTTLGALDRLFEERAGLLLDIEHVEAREAHLREGEIPAHANQLRLHAARLHAQCEPDSPHHSVLIGVGLAWQKVLKMSFDTFYNPCFLS